MSDKEDFKLTERDKQGIRRLAKKAKATYDFLDREGLTGAWSGDTERFMAFTYGTTEALVEHSKTLSRWTKTLEFTTVVLACLAVAQIILLIL